jgi:hypothetical protein
MQSKKRQLRSYNINFGCLDKTLPKNPTICYDMERGTFKVTSEDLKKHGKIECSNQAHCVLENVKKCSECMGVPEGEKPYISVKWHKRKPRQKVPYEKDAFSWDLWRE